MSIVLAVQKGGRTVIAADSLTVFGDSERSPAENCHTPKLFRIGSSIFSVTGWAVYDDIIRDLMTQEETPPDLEGPRQIFAFFMRLWKQLHEHYPFVNDQAQSKESPFGDLDSSFLIANPAGIYKVSSDMGVTRFLQYYAIGSGAEYALGAVHCLYDELDAAAIARRGVETAIAFDVHCGGKVDLMTIE